MMNKIVSAVMVLFMVIGLLTSSCGSTKNVSKKNSKKEIVGRTYSQAPPTYIYKTKNNYNSNVPIILSDDKTRIISFPDPDDVYYQGKLAEPVNLEQGYLLDVRGISKNVAFISLTYEEYSKLGKAPSADKLMLMIIDDDPLEELFNCSNYYRLGDKVDSVNNLIENNLLDKCIKVL